MAGTEAPSVNSAQDVHMAKPTDARLNARLLKTAELATNTVQPECEDNNVTPPDVHELESRARFYKLLWHGKNGQVVAPEAGLVQQLHDLLCLSHLPLTQRCHSDSLHHLIAAKRRYNSASRQVVRCLSLAASN